MTTHEILIEELYHNLFRMHGYVESLKLTIDGQRTGVLKNADSLLLTSYARCVEGLPASFRLEKPGVKE